MSHHILSRRLDRLIRAIVVLTVVASLALAAWPFERVRAVSNPIDRCDINGYPVDTNGVRDMAWADLSGCTIVGADLSGANLRYADLRDASVSDSDLTGADLRDAGLFATAFERVTLDDADLRVLGLSGATFTDSSLERVNLQNVRVIGTFTRASLQAARLDDAFISMTTFTSVNFAGASFNGAGLDVVEFNTSDLTDADFTAASLQSVAWNDTICSDGSNSEVQSTGQCEAGNLIPNQPPSEPGKPHLSSGETITNDDQFELRWDAATDANGNTVTYSLQRKRVTDSVWTTVTTGQTISSFTSVAEAPEPEGIWEYRVIAHDHALSTEGAASEPLTIDRTAPTIVGLPSELIVSTFDRQGANVTWDAPVVTDNIDATPTSTCDPPSGSYFAVRTVTVACSALDDAGNTNLATFEVTVRMNQGPQIDPYDPTPSVPEGTTTTLSYTVSDPDGDPVRVQSSYLPSFVTLQQSGDTWTLSATPAANQQGSHWVFIAFESAGGTAYLELVLVVEDTINSAPVIAPIADRTHVPGDPLEIRVTAADPEGDVIVRLSVSGLPPMDAWFNDLFGGVGSIQVSPFIRPGTYPITITATDDRASSSLTFTLTVLDPNVIPTRGSAEIYPIVTTVSGMSGTIADIDVSLPQLRHTFPADLDLLLVGPGGQAVLLMSDAGGGLDVTDVRLTFDDEATARLPQNKQVSSGRYQPTNFGTWGDVLDDPAPLGPFATSLSVFDGTDPNGEWKLFVWDDNYADGGLLVGDVELTIALDEPPTIERIADQTLDEGETRTISISASDPNGDAVTLSAIGLPAFATLIDLGGGNGTLELTPGATDAGTYGVTITATAGGGSAHTMFAVVVNDTIFDTTPPTVSAIVAPAAPASGWYGQDVTVSFTASDDAGGSGVKRILYWTDGAESTNGPRVIDGASGSVTIVASGETRVWFSAIDNAGNRGADDLVVVKIDRAVPQASAPAAAFTANQTAGSATIPLTVTWSGSDGESGVARYELQQKTNSGSYQSVATSGSATSVTRQVSPGSVYQFRVRAIDQAGNAGPWAVSAVLAPTAVDSTAARYTGSWKRQAHSGAYRSSVHYATAAGATASATLNGTSLAWLATTGPDRGIARVYVDGVLYGTVDLYSSRTTTRTLAFVVSDLAPGNHELKVEVAGTRNRQSRANRVDVDAFVAIATR